MDISSLAVDGVFNYEHKSDTPAQIIGKVLQAKKIFSDKDCDDDHQLYFWNKVKTPYLYVMGELFDDYKESAKDVAGMFRYDADKKEQNERAVMNFSIEGAKISKEGIDVTRSIARKVTITALPCNKAAVAEMVQVQQKKSKKGDLDQFFKTEYSDIEIQILQKSESDKLLERLKKDDGGAGVPGASGLALSEKVKPTMKKAANLKIAPTLPNKPSTAADHTTLAEHHHGIAQNTGNSISRRSTSAAKASFHRKMAGNIAMASQESKIKVNNEESKKNTLVGAPKPPPQLFDPRRSGTNKPPGPVEKAEPKVSNFSTKSALKSTGPTAPIAATPVPPKPLSNKPLAKTLTAGSGLAAPGNLSGGAALASQSLKKDSVSSSLAPKDRKVKELQSKIDAGTYKPDANKIADKMINTPKPSLKKAGATGGGAGSASAGMGGGSLSGYAGGPNPANTSTVMVNPKKKKLGMGASIGQTTMIKSEWLQRAEQEYANWGKREQFETFMKSRMPHLTKGEIIAIGQTMILNKSMKMEKKLSSMAKKDGCWTGYEHTPGTKSGDKGSCKPISKKK